MGKNNTLFDIIGPIMIGPSSSHTAGAIRIGNIARKIFGEKPESVEFKLYNSFAKTGKGHGTDKGLLGGVLGYDVDDEKIKTSYKEAKKQGIDFKFQYLEKNDRHPNSVDIIFRTENSEMEISGQSVGGGEILINKINGYQFDINGEFNTLILLYKDKPGMVYRVTALLSAENINIATMYCDRDAKGNEAAMSICVDGQIPDGIVEKLKQVNGMYLIRNIEAIQK